MSIEDFPQPPAALVQQLRDGKVVPFVGAGLSMDVGLPGWGELVKPLREELGLNDAKLDHLEIADCYRSEMGRPALESHLIEKLDRPEIEPGENHDLLFDLCVRQGCREAFTTNFDPLVEDCIRNRLGKKVHVIPEDEAVGSYDRSQRIQVVKLHGDLHKVMRIVLTRSDFDGYVDGHPKMLERLAEACRDATVLFIGYGLADFHITSLLAHVRDRYELRPDPFLVAFDQRPIIVRAKERQGIRVVNLPLPDGLEDREAKARARSEALTRFLRSLRAAVCGEPEGRPSTAAASLAQTTRPPEQYHTYLRTVLSRCGVVDLKGFESERLPPEVGMQEIYVPLETTASREGRESRPDAEEDRRAAIETSMGDERDSAVPLEEALTADRCLVLLGDPGSGKTTFLRHTAWLLARARHEGEDAERAAREILPFDGPLPFPLFVSFRHFQEFCRREEGRACAGKPLETAEEFLLRSLRGMGARDLDRAALGRLFDSPGGAILLGDGLDEEAHADRRRLLLEALQALVETHEHLRACLTGRSAAYTGNLRLGGPFTVKSILELGPEEIQAFCRGWDAMLEARHISATGTGRSGPTESDREDQSLHEAVRASPDVERLASNPLMLTAIAVVHYNQRRLPEDRAELYERVVRNLLARRDLPRPAAGEGPADPLTVGERLRLFEELALEMHRERTRVTGWETILDAFTRGLRAVRGRSSGEIREEARIYMELAKTASGLLATEDVEDRYAFAHQTFQEFLAARRLMGVTQAERDAVLSEDVLADAWWREPVRLLVGRHKMEGQYEKAEEVLDAVRDLRPASEEQSALQSALVAECLADLDRTRPGDRIRDEMVDDLVRKVEDPGLDIHQKLRIRLGAALGELEDPRIEGGDGGFGPMVVIPEGRFVRGDESVYGGGPAREIFLSSYAIDRYPVTNARFARFVEAGGYTEAGREWWSEEGWAARNEYGWRQPALWDDRRFNRPNQPVVGVSWFEAEAYARFAGRRLPTEAQWEKAAKGWWGQRAYPWDDEWDPSRANAEGSLGSACAVGCHPGGVWREALSDDGGSVSLEAAPLDMVGNVWEWCADWFDSAYYLEDTSPDRDPPGPPEGEEESTLRVDPNSGKLEPVLAPGRVLRGGSWYDPPRLCRVSYRCRYHPTLRLNLVGFRCAQWDSPES